MESDEPRHISVPLMAGLIILPIVFVWLLFRRGYARSTRIAGLFAAFTIPVLYNALRLIVYALGLPTT